MHMVYVISWFTSYHCPYLPTAVLIFLIQDAAACILLCTSNMGTTQTPAIATKAPIPNNYLRTAQPLRFDGKNPSWQHNKHENVFLPWSTGLTFIKGFHLHSHLTRWVHWDNLRSRHWNLSQNITRIWEPLVYWEPILQAKRVSKFWLIAKQWLDL